MLRQDNNSIYVFDGNYNQITTLRTGTTPTQLAVTLDDNYLLVGHDNSQLVYVYDLNSLQKAQLVQMPFGHYPRSIGVSSRAILAASRVAGPMHMIDKIDLTTGLGSTYSTLGVFTNSVNINTVLQGTPNGTAVMGVMPDGNVILYDATADSFTVSRKDFTALSGAYGASSFGRFVVGNNLLNESLVPVGTLTSATATVAGFAFTPTGSLLTGAGSTAGIIQARQYDRFLGSTGHSHCRAPGNECDRLCLFYPDPRAARKREFDCCVDYVGIAGDTGGFRCSRSATADFTDGECRGSDEAGCSGRAGFFVRNESQPHEYGDQPDSAS